MEKKSKHSYEIIVIFVSSSFFTEMLYMSNQGRCSKVRPHGKSIVLLRRIVFLCNFCLLYVLLQAPNFSLQSQIGGLTLAVHRLSHR